MTPRSPVLDPSSSLLAIDELLRRTRARLRRHYLLEGVAGVLLLWTLCGAAVLGVALAVPFGAGMRWGALGVALALAAFWVTFRWLRPLWRFSREDALALHLERCFPELRTRLISAVQLGRELPVAGDSSDAPISRSLVLALLDDAAHLGVTLELERALPPRRWLQSSAATFLLGALLCAFALIDPERMERALLNLAGGRALLLPASDTEVAHGPPLIADLTLRFSYPEYTGLPPRVVEGSSGAITAVKGTVVQLTARSAIPLSGAELRLGSETVPLRLSGGRLLEGALTVIESGTYRFFLDAEEGGRRPGTPPMKIDVETDRHPRIRILAPGPEVVVGERGKVELRFVADDDFGLRDLALVYKVEGSARPEQEKRLKAFEKAPRNLEDGATLSVFELGFRPGERIAYRLRVHDNDTVSGPKVGDSATQYIKVYSPRERHLELIEEEKRIWEEMVHLLGEQLLLREEARARTAAALALAEDLAKKSVERAGKIGVRFDAMLATAREDKMFDARSMSTLEGVRRRLRERAAREAAWRTGSVGRPDSRLAELAAFMPRHVLGIETDVLLLEKLQKQQKLEALRALSQELVDSQKRLRDLFERYRKSRDPELKAEIEREIARLEEQVRELRQKLAELFDSDDEFVNLDAVKAKDLQESASKMKDAMQKGDLEGAMKQLERMSKELQNTLEKVDLSAKSFYESAFYKNQKEMEKLLDEVHELESAQREAMKETQSVEKTARGRAAKELDVGKSEAAKKVARKLEDAERKAGAAQQALQTRWNQELADRARARAEDARRALEQGDASESLDMSKRSLEHLQQLEENLSRERPWRTEPQGEQGQEAHEQARGAGRSMKEAVRELERMIPKAQNRLSSEERGKLEQLGKRQRGLRERTGRLKRRLEEMGEDAPFFGDEAKQSLEKAHEEMAQAEGKLGRGAPREASQHEQGAAESLGRLKDQLQQAMKQGASPGGGGQKDGQEKEGEGQNMSREPVVIPGAEEHKAPKEFREDLLKAMKQGVPGPYRDLVRRYYEEIVR